MDQQTYRVTLSDGRSFDVTTEGGPPSEEDVYASLEGSTTPKAPRRASRAEDFMEPSTVPAQTTGRVLETAWDAIKSGAEGAWRVSGVPGMMREGPVGAIKDQAGVVGGILQSHYDQYRKAKLAEAEGRTSEMFGHSLAAAIPFVGPLAASIGEKAGTGDIAGAGGEALGNIIGGIAPELTLKGAAAGFKARQAGKITRASKLGAQVEGDLAMAVPASKSAPYTPEDFRAAKPYINAQHQQAPITTVTGLRDALDNAIGDVEGRMTGYLESFPTARISLDVQGIVQKAVGDSPRGKALDAAMRELEDLPLDRDLDLVELDRLRLQMNAENKAAMKKNSYDRETARKTDPAFAAREALANEIRDRLYGYLENRGVEGVRQLRRDEGSLIKLRNAAERQTMAGGRPVAGTNEPGMVRRVAGEVVEKGATAAGAAMGGPVGAVLGSQIGESIGKGIRGSRSTRDDLVARAFAVADDRVPTFPTVPAQPKPAGLLPAAPIELGATPDGSFVRGVPAEVARPERKALPAGRPSIETPAGPDGSGPIEPTLPEHYTREKAELEQAFGPEDGAVAALPKEESAFVLRWMADDLREMSFTPGQRMGRAQRLKEWEERAAGDKDVTYQGRIAGTPIQEMFHAAGIKGTRKEIAARLDRYMQTGKGNPRIGAIVKAMREAWDGRRFDFEEVSDATLAEIGIRRRDLRSPSTTPYPDDMPDVYERFMQKSADPDLEFDPAAFEEGQ